MSTDNICVWIMDQVQLPIPPVVRWLEVSHRPPTGDDSELVLNLVPTEDTAEEAYLRLDLPARIHRAPLDGSAFARPDDPDVVLDMSSGDVAFSESDSARIVQQLADGFPAPKSLKRFTAFAEIPYTAALTLLASLVAADAPGGVRLPTVLVEGNPIERERALLYSVLWLCNFHHVVQSHEGDRVDD